MTLKQKEVEAALLRKGFRENETHHTYFVYYDEAGKKTRARTKTSHGNRELNSFLISQMAKQVFLTKKDFAKLVDCSLNQSDYEEKVRDRL